MNLFHVIDEGIFELEKMLVKVLVPVLLVTVFFDVFFRYVLNSPLIWGQEISLFAFIWTSFIGASMSIKTQEAVSVTILVDRINDFFRNFFILIGMLISLVFLIFFSYLAINWISDPSILMERTETTGIPMVIPYLCIPVSLLFMTFHMGYITLSSINKCLKKRVLE